MSELTETTVSIELQRIYPFSVAIASERLVGEDLTIQTNVHVTFCGTEKEAEDFGRRIALEQYPIEEGYVKHAVSTCRGTGNRTPRKMEYAISIAADKEEMPYVEASIGFFSSAEAANTYARSRAEAVFRESDGYSGVLISVVQVPRVVVKE